MLPAKGLQSQQFYSGCKMLDSQSSWSLEVTCGLALVQCGILFANFCQPLSQVMWNNPRVPSVMVGIRNPKHGPLVISRAHCAMTLHMLCEILRINRGQGRESRNVKQMKNPRTFRGVGIGLGRQFKGGNHSSF
ncbi:hypothetical protein MKW98_002812 [Papaver atlanticum]|uniref:Uncharacterized protein n=1 Tax=Papaver atlanticum TaxID=357466 RepID=A0AAD4X587_9MAGN|nr:hypothetical protein MKW98_002812 [Papaver atlanticum]